MASPTVDMHRGEALRSADHLDGLEVELDEGILVQRGKDRRQVLLEQLREFNRADVAYPHGQQQQQQFPEASHLPLGVAGLPFTLPPELNPSGMHTGDDTHAFGNRVEAGMPGETPGEFSGVIGAHVQKHQTVGGMTEMSFAEIFVQREKRHAPKPVESRDDFSVLRAKVNEVAANLPTGHAPLPQERVLIFGKILVEQVHAAASAGDLDAWWECRRPCSSKKECCASRTASATAASGMRPPQRLLQMKSHDRPSATSSSTCQTMMRVPLNVGLPWQICGSATMYLPNSTRAEEEAGCEPFFMGGN